MKSSYRIRLVSLFLLFAVAAEASPELDRRYALETVACLRPIDNADQIFNQVIETELRDYFGNQTRFVLRDFSRVDAIVKQSRLPYAKVVQDPEILTQIARGLSAEGLIRTQFVQTGNTYVLTLDWISALQLDLLATETVRIPASSNETLIHDLRVEIRKALDALIRQVPYVGHVTGRDGGHVTLNLGRLSGLKPGDVAIISTVAEAKRHPILKKLVGWDLREVGRVQIEEAEERISFGTVLVEDEPITRYMKVTSVVSAPRAAIQAGGRGETSEESVTRPKPKLGWMTASAWLGSHSRSYSVVSGSSFEGGGTLFGAKAFAHLWLTRQVFVDGTFQFGLFSYSQKDAVTSTLSTISGSATLSRIQFTAGYSHFLTGDSDGPRVFGRLGFGSVSYLVPVSAAELAGSSSFSGLLLGVGADVPLFEIWGSEFEFNLGLFKSAANPDIASAGTSLGASEVSFYLGGYYRYTPNLTIKAGFDLFFNNATFDSSGTLSRLGHTSLVFSPSISYLF